MRRLAFLAIVVTFVQPAAAQPATVTTTPGKTVQVGYYSFLKADCSGGAKPEVRAVAPPTHGEVIVKSATLTTKRLKQCAEVKAPAVVILYKADPTFVGSTGLAFDVINSETGQVQRVSATVEIAADRL